MENIFDKNTSDKVIQRINNLDHTKQPLWGKMNASQMLAHCCVTYEMVYDNKHPKTNFVMRLMLKAFIKKAVVGPAPYKRNSPTAPAFLVSGEREFETEKKRLVDYINKTRQLGQAHFDGKASLSFGPLSKDEWNTMFYKHLDHHLSQFGV